MPGRAFLLMSALLAALAAAEFLLPLVRPHLGTMQQIVHHVDDSGRYYLKPEVEILFSGMFEPISPPVVWQTNGQGFRATNDAGPPSTKFRIATYGDSETFGWSVALEDTFQKRMEGIAGDVEVLNLGIPGYNVENIAHRIEDTLRTWSPDLVVYLVNKNDVDLPNDISDAVLHSELLLRMRFFWQVVVTKPWRQKRRESPERNAFMAGQLDRMARFASEQGVPLMLVFMKSYTWERAAAQAAPGGFVSGARDARTIAAASQPLPVQVVMAEDWLRPFRRLDDHLPRQAHEVLAQNLCARIAGTQRGSCAPAQWNGRDLPSRAAGSRPTSPAADDALARR